MIVDRIENADLYLPLSPRIATALKALRDTDLASRPVGRYELDGSNVFALVQRYESKPFEQGVWEAHRKHIDVQFVAAGIERMGWAPINTLKVKTPYDEKIEAELYTGSGNMIVVPAGSFTIFFPTDGHMPCVAVEAPQTVSKIVVKIRVG